MGRRGFVSAFLLLLGCAPKGTEVLLQFEGRPAFGNYLLDTRAIRELCPSCRQPVEPGAARCLATKDGHPCGTALAHPKRTACGFCRSTRKCAPCAAFESEGRCRFCAGAGTLGPGQACFNCGGAGRCAACGGSAVCDACSGTGQLSLPWTPRASPPLAAAPSSPAGVRPQALEAPIAWLGESIPLPPPKGNPSEPWQVFRAEDGFRRDAEKVVGSPARFIPKQAGAFMAQSGQARLFFDVVELVIQGLSDAEEPSRDPARTVRLDLRPSVRAPRIGWDWVTPDGQVKRLEGATATLKPERRGQHQLWPVVGLGGLPERRGPRSATLAVADLGIVTPKDGRVAAGTPAPFEVRSNPPLPEGTAYEWTRVSEKGERSVLASNGPSLRMVFPSAGRYRLSVNAGGSRSSGSQITALAASVSGPDGKPVPEARVTPAGGGAAGLPGPYHVVVEDPETGGPSVLALRSLAEDGSELFGPVTLSLGPGGGRRSTEGFFLFTDRSDLAAGERRILARPRGRLEISYRGLLAGSIDVGPMIVHDIPVRFFLVRGSRSTPFPSLPEIERALDLRLAQANEIWSPFGRRFTRAFMQVAELPHNLLLVRGRAGGVDEHGRPGRAGVLVDGVPIEVPTAWQSQGGPVTPRTTAISFLAAASSTCAVEMFENLLQSDREAVILRVGPLGHGGIRLEPLAAGEDVAQSLRPIQADVADGCEVASQRSLLTLEEIAVVLGARGTRGEGLDLFVVGALQSSGRPFDFKIYPAWAFPEALSDSALVSWPILDGSGKYPYALARVLGLLILPAGEGPSEEDTLFKDPLSEGSGPTAHKRVSAPTGARIQERGRARRRGNDPIGRYKERGIKEP